MISSAQALGIIQVSGLHKGVFKMLFAVEIELTWKTLYIRIGSFERFYNTLGLPSGSGKGCSVRTT